MVGFLRRFSLKTGLDFAQFGLESGLVFEGTTGVYERIYTFSSKWLRKKDLVFFSLYCHLGEKLSLKKSH